MKPNEPIVPSNLESAFPALRDVVRETARRLGKEARLQLSGVVPNLDAEAMAGLQDALVQALMNAVDHGIEPVTGRTKAGKPATGQISVDFSEGADGVVVVVRDDGPGVDLAAVGRKAVGLGLIDAGETLPPKETLALLFHPGFSTKTTVTEVSGRGIGLDIVQAAVAALAGTVEIDTARGAGTALVLRIPRKSPARAA